MKKIMSIVLVFVVFFSVFILGCIIFGHIFNQRSEYSATIIGAFLGAFFAYVFLRIGDFFVRLYDRKKKHYDALVKLEYSYNTNLDLLSGNIFEIAQFKKMASLIDNNKRVITPTRLNNIPIDESLLLSLSNIDLINKVFSYNARMSKLNNSMESINRLYDDLKNGLTDGKMDFMTYKINFLYMCDKLLELEKFLIRLDEETERLIAIAEVLTEDKPLLSYFIGKGPSLQKLSKQIEQRIVRLKTERNRIKEESEKEIRETLNS